MRLKKVMLIVIVSLQETYLQYNAHASFVLTIPPPLAHLSRLENLVK